ncbi:MAG: hypothetical protein KDF65_03340, partial [Anaerolineae bacterium]|nr:hypothetical protein [Anaerolineae bacterium]
MNHTLYPTLASLLAPATLSHLTGHPISAVECLPLHATYNKSGSRLQVVQTNQGQGPELVLKQVSAAWDWQMRATQDHCGRAVQVWRAGLLDRLPPQLVHGILACAQDEAGWAILMQNLAGAMLPFSPMSRADLEISLEAMAAMHATFFEEPALTRPELGLCPLSQTYTLFAPPT